MNPFNPGFQYLFTIVWTIVSQALLGKTPEMARCFLLIAAAKKRVENPTQLLPPMQAIRGQRNHSYFRNRFTSYHEKKSNYLSKMSIIRYKQYNLWQCSKFYMYNFANRSPCLGFCKIKEKSFGSKVPTVFYQLPKVVVWQQQQPAIHLLFFTSSIRLFFCPVLQLQLPLPP